MMRWTRGEADIERMLTAKELQRIQGDAADGAGWLEKAGVVLSSARELLESDPNSAYTLAYDAARFACARPSRPTGATLHNDRRPLRDPTGHDAPVRLRLRALRQYAPP